MVTLELGDDQDAWLRGVDATSVYADAGLPTDTEAAALSHRCLGEGVTDQELAHAPEWDRPLLEMYRGVTDPNSDPNRAL